MQLRWDGRYQVCVLIIFYCNGERIVKMVNQRYCKNENGTVFWNSVFYDLASSLPVSIDIAWFFSPFTWLLFSLWLWADSFGSSTQVSGAVESPARWRWSVQPGIVHEWFCCSCFFIITCCVNVRCCHQQLVISCTSLRENWRHLFSCLWQPVCYYVTTEPTTTTLCFKKHHPYYFLITLWYINRFQQAVGST